MCVGHRRRINHQGHEGTRRKTGLAKAGAAEFLAEVFTFHLDHAAHFVQAGAHAFSDAVAESFIARSRSGGRHGAVRAGGGLVFKIRGDDGGAVVVVAGVENEADGIPNPFGGLDRAELIEHQHVSLKHGAKNVELGGLNGGVIRILNFLQQFAIIVEKAGYPFVEDELFCDSDCEMSFAGADLADDQQTCAIARIVLLGEFAGGEMRECQRRMGAWEIRGVAGELAMLVTAWNIGRGQQTFIAFAELAIAARDAPIFGRPWLRWQSLPSGAFAQRANLSLCLDCHEPL